MPQLDYSWLILLRRLEPSEIEQDREVFRFLHYPQTWKELRSQMVDGDEMWEFECSEGNRHELSGCTGIALKRGDEIIGHVRTSAKFY